MIIDIGDIIFYKDKVLKVVEITKDYFLDNEIITYYFDNGDHMDDGSSRHIEIMNDYVKDDNYIVSKAKYREIRINKILEE